MTELSSPHSILTRHKHFAEKKTQLGVSKEAPLEIDDEGDPPILREESDDEVKINLSDLPPVEESTGQGTADDAIDVDGSAEGDAAAADVAVESDDKKKMGLNTVYDGFQIYGRILCLVVRRKDVKGRQSAGGTGQAMVEEWISSTQANENAPRD